MSKQGPTRARPWQPMVRAHRVPATPERIRSLRAQAEAMGQDPDAAEALLHREVEMWKNDRYTVIVERERSAEGILDPDSPVLSLSIRRNDRKPDMPWRHLQRIKNELVGEEFEAVELFPAESRLVDTANQRWLWVAPPGAVIDVGFNMGRLVGTPEQAAALGARQEPWDA